jgi:adenylate cyclase class IV
MRRSSTSAIPHGCSRRFLATELEVKAVVPDPAAVRLRLIAAGAVRSFRGMLRDRRFDRGGELEGLDQVLRLRRWIPGEGLERAEIGWKGRTAVSPEGYKQREEIEVIAGNGADAARLLESLGYGVSHAIDRYVEVYLLDDVVARLEWYPRMDVLVEIEGTPVGIERLIAITGLPRESCVADALVLFAARFAARTGRPAILSEAALGDESPTWSAA